MKTLLAPTQQDLSLRWMVHHDMAQVTRISRQRAGLHWKEEDFLENLRSINTIGLVAEYKDNVVGYIIYQIKRQLVDLEEEPRPLLHIDLRNISVSPEMQGKGVGRSMLNRLEQKIQRDGGCIRAAVPESNLTAQLFLRDAGYRANGILRDYYGDEDAYLMERWARHG